MEKKLLNQKITEFRFVACGARTIKTLLNPSEGQEALGAFSGVMGLS